MLITTSNRRQAEEIAKALVRKKLAACANLITPVTSIFRWKGRVEKARETLLVVKTSAPRYSALEKMVRSMHSYDVPEIIGIDVKHGLRPYVEWLRNETATN